MYPHAELTQLALRKLELRRAIAERRATCISAATRATQPLAWLDRAIGFFKRAAPLLPVLSAPLVLANRKPGQKTSLFGSMVKWGPLVFQAMRFARSGAAPASTARSTENQGLHTVR